MAISNKISILIVDDESETRLTIKEILREIGFKNFKDVKSGKDAIKFLNDESKVDLLICDYAMPAMNGIEVFEQMKEIGKSANTKFILMSSDSDQQIIVQAIKKGIKSIILKPFSKQDLMNEIAKLMG